MLAQKKTEDVIARIFAEIVRLSSNWDHKLAGQGAENLRFEDRGSICAQFTCDFVFLDGSRGKRCG